MEAAGLKSYTRGLPGQLGSSSKSSMTGSYRRCRPYMRTVVAPIHSTTSSTIPYLHEVTIFLVSRAQRLPDCVRDTCSGMAFQHSGQHWEGGSDGEPMIDTLTGQTSRVSSLCQTYGKMYDGSIATGVSLAGISPHELRPQI